MAAPRDQFLDLLVAPHEAGPLPALVVKVFWKKKSQEERKLSSVVVL